MTVLYVIIGLIVAAVIVAKLYLCIAGKEKIVVKTDAPFVVESQTDDAIVISKKLTFVNEGKQCATIMDALVRPQLPYEQYDGEPREDDYFEAVLIQKLGDANHEDKLNIFAKVKLTPRKGMTLKEALSHMVDLPLDVIWMETGRTPWHYTKVRLTLSAEEIAKLAGVELVKD